MIKVGTYELISGKAGKYRREIFQNPNEAIAAYHKAAESVRDRLIWSASLARYDDRGFPIVVRQIESESDCA